MPGKIEVTLTKSMIGRPEKHRRILRGVGLTKLNKTVTLENSPSIRGMLEHVSHLIRAKEISNETT